MPFLENVTRGRGIPRHRLEEVAEHYHHFGGKSPINEQNLLLIQALQQALKENGPDLPVFYGNRNWHPYLADTLREMGQAGHRQTLAFFTSAFSSYSGCRQYRENIAAAQQEVGESAPHVDKLRMFYNHPGFLQPLAERVQQAWKGLPDPKVLLFTAHSIPQTMADHCNYQRQLAESTQLVADLAGVSAYELVYQSRSGSPHQPWLEPDCCDRIRELANQGIEHVVVLPIGFISDHMEVLFDLDTEVAELCQELGVGLTRLPTIGTHPDFISMIVELIQERCGLRPERRFLGRLGPSHDTCPSQCCLLGLETKRPAQPKSGE